MEHAVEHANQQPKNKGIVEKVYQVRLWKSIILPCEIVGEDGTKTKDCGEKDEEKAC